LRTDRCTDMTKLIFACRNFANAPKNRFLGRYLNSGPLECGIVEFYYTADLYSKKWAIFVKNMAVLSGFRCSLSKVKCGRRVKLTTHLHSVRRLRMSGVPVLPVYAFRASQGKLYLIYGSPYDSYNFGCVQVLTHEPVKYRSVFLSVH